MSLFQSRLKSLVSAYSAEDGGTAALAERSQIDDRYKWNLDLIFPDWDKISGVVDAAGFRNVRYTLEIKSDGDTRRTVLLRACAKRYASFSVHSHEYVTEVIFLGM
jgi:hypothetical protein